MKIRLSDSGGPADPARYILANAWLLEKTLPARSNQLAKPIVDVATGQIEAKTDPRPEDVGKDPAAVFPGRRGGLKGDNAGGSNDTRGARAEIARKAATKRWSIGAVKVIFANVDVASSDNLKPKPRSRKGAGTERVCGGNLFGSLPEFAPRQPAAWATYYLMVDENGAAELTRPVVRDGTFTSYIERIYLSDGSDMEGTPVVLDDGEVPDEFDPQVVRK